MKDVHRESKSIYATNFNVVIIDDQQWYNASMRYVNNDDNEHRHTERGTYIKMSRLSAQFAISQPVGVIILMIDRLSSNALCIFIGM